MYISIKLPPEFGSFNRIRKENYPFNNLFTAYLAAISRLGLSHHMDVEELVGYIEDRVFDGQRLPDVPTGNEPVNLRYKTEDPDVVKYIGGSSLTNRMAVMYIARMTLRLSAAYGTSLFRLMRLINDLQDEGQKTVKDRHEEQPITEQPVPKPKTRYEEKRDDVPVKMPGIRISGKAAEQQPVQIQEPQTSSVSESAEAAKAALSELASLTAQADMSKDEGGNESDVVQTNPFLEQFGGI